MAAVKTRQVPLGTYPNGTRNYGPIACPLGLDQLMFRVGRCTTADPTIWPNASTILKVHVDWSFDGGLNYISSDEWSQGGGIIVDRHSGVEAVESAFSWQPILYVDGVPTQPTHFKGFITVTGGPIKTYMDVTVLQ